MTHFIQHTQCPKCLSLGKDRNANNLGNYSDGSCYCFSCGYFRSSTNCISTHQKSKTTLYYPRDTTTEFPNSVKTYLSKYNFSEREIKKHLIEWSPYWERLCFPFFDDTGLIGWQGRSFNPNKPKWFSQGDLKCVIHILGNNFKNSLVLVEDIVSSIVLNSQTTETSMSLFGSHLNLNKLQNLQILGYHKFILWLDKDKEKESLKYSYKARQLGYNCVSLVTDKDPKDYDKETLKKYLTERTKCATLN